MWGLNIDGNGWQLLKIGVPKGSKGQTNQVHQFWGAENLELKSYGR